MSDDRPFGKAWLDGRTWHVKGEPHLLLKMKRVFAKIDKREHGEITLSHSDETCRDLEWFATRYALEIAPRDRAIMEAGARCHKDTLQRLEGLIDGKYQPKPFALAIPAREYQRRAAEVYLVNKYLLLGDDVGLGKTASSICSLTDRRTLPAVVVTLSGTMPLQWRDEIRRFAPALFAHVIEAGTPSYALPKRDGRGPDVLIINYHKLSGWAETLAAYSKSVIFDECQELRRRESKKYTAARHLARACEYRIGLSATPTYNFGGEIWNVVDVLKEGILGTKDEFEREWCVSEGRHLRVKDPRALGSHLREHFIMLRRTRAEVGRELPKLQRITQRVGSNSEALDAVEDSVAALAKIILAGGKLERGQKMRATEEFSNVLRQATGIGKASYVGDFIRLLVESGEKVLVYAWHRAVYDILLSKLDDLRPAMFTGEESAKEKQESKERFMRREPTPQELASDERKSDDWTDVMLMSLRAGAGIDGLQHTCRTVVFAELDWSPGVHIQCIGRVNRDGQKDPVAAYFLVSEEGSDPTVAEMLGLKREQGDGIIDPHHEVAEQVDADPDRARKLAEHYLQKAKDKEQKKRTGVPA